MCGITGIYAFNGLTDEDILDCKKAIQDLDHRGPDYQTTLKLDRLCLGHSRLSIIDTSESANQPFQDESGRYNLVYNGEIFNYKALRKELADNYSTNFQTESDTEVLLYWLINKGTKGLAKLNGFFAFALYDGKDKSLLLARDRFGIKPLLYYHNTEKFIFSSELGSLQKFGFKKELDYSSLYSYLQLSYVPSPFSMYKNVGKVEPGIFIRIESNGKIQTGKYYELHYGTSSESYKVDSYSTAQKKIIELLNCSVEKRLVADVPLGTFLSGGVDSSIITAIASQQKKNLSTFSIGYADEPFFDETEYALALAKKFGTEHHVFKMDNNDIKNSIYSILEDNTEPFADSSAIAVNFLAQKTREHVTVALSGDGADELFSGYHKHQAEYYLRKYPNALQVAQIIRPLLKILPQSRNSKIGNIGRQLSKLMESARYPTKERYWYMASIMEEKKASELLQFDCLSKEYLDRKYMHLQNLKGNGFNEVLLSDFNLVLPSDMLHKVDSMSMKNSLEVRVPFLDHELVNYVFQLPSDYKIKGNVKKRILQDAFRTVLPKQIYHRPKKGFEIPLLKLLRGDLNHLVDEKLLSDEFLIEQNIFDPMAVKTLKAQLNSTQPSNSQQIIWSLLLFNTWWIKNF